MKKFLVLWLLFFSGFSCVRLQIQRLWEMDSK